LCFLSYSFGERSPSVEWRRNQVVEALNELEDDHPGFALRSEATAIEQFAFERGEEALAHRVVVSVADGAGGRPDASLLAAGAEGDGRVLRAPA
jgi:hypothetical protein